MDAIKWISRHEGEVFVCYDDATGQHVVPGYTLVGHPTIGRGRCLDTNGISPAESLYLLTSELDKARTPDLKTIFNARWDGLGLPRQAALLDMHYALGSTGFRKFHIFITAVMNQDWAAAKAALLDSDWARNPKTATRAAEDADIILNGVFP